ncbi:hypothetical protein LO763_19525 [Glycomyces sp. A-F 0318]|uniref:hypothetical protein n=1 Tax=Glycomyces amatae TaxID=2881355 RepID=UPI001E4A0394|nr:hypothetical protein [Glycomyces amatae]MCD0445802.1 hypothetical protein [Glycomyces amatae]
MPNRDDERSLSNIDILEGTWVHLEDTTFTYTPGFGTPIRRRLQVWAGLSNWRLAVVTEPGDGPTVAAAPTAAFRALREQYGPDIALIEDHPPALAHGFATPYLWLLEDGAGGVFSIPFAPTDLERALPGLSESGADDDR